MITFETLELARFYQQKENYGDEAVAMFDELGNFNSDNWNGGDSVIRQFFSSSEENGCFCEQFVKEVEFDHVNDTHFTGNLITSHSIGYGDNHYATVTLDGWLDNGYWNNRIFNTINLNWYKNRGKTRRFTQSYLENNDEMVISIDESKYLLMLNAIEATGFKFNFWV